MKPLPSQERAVLKRAALIAAAIEEFSTIGFEVATAKSVAARAGVATGTFYQYFDNKNDILCVIASDRFDLLHEQIKSLKITTEHKANFKEPELSAIFIKNLKFVYQFHALAPELHQVLEQRRMLDPELTQIMYSGEQVLRERLLSFVQSFNVKDASLVADNLFAMGEGIVHRLVFDQSDENVDRSLGIGAEMIASYFEQSALKR